MGAGALSALFGGLEHGFTSGPFVESASRAALSLVTFGQSRWVAPVAKKVAPVVNKVAEEGKELVSSIVGGLSSRF